MVNDNAIQNEILNINSGDVDNILSHMIVNNYKMYNKFENEMLLYFYQKIRIIEASKNKINIVIEPFLDALIKDYGSGPILQALKYKISEKGLKIKKEI